ncbi:2-oxo acid dehydrogenase subunit E2, partial [Halapricum sp. CBA1109]|uniref:biotin/lipoyl-containing protein n=1 Tax=Halapricum sp. CBA1109 TaxID=2668068 RepID=UPI0013BA7114
MTVEFRLPDVGEGVAEGEIVRWLVETGDTVTEDQPVVEVETDKAVVEVPAPVNGTVAQRHAAAGDVVPVGDVLVTFEPDDDTSADADDTETAEPDDGGADEASAGTNDDGTAEATDGTREPTAGVVRGRRRSGDWP